MVTEVSSVGEFFFVVGGPYLIYRMRSNGLIGDAGRHALRVTAGCEAEIPVETEALTELPAFDSGAWDAAAEHDIVVGEDGLTLANAFGEYVWDGPDLAVSGAGQYRVRVSVRGRSRSEPGLYRVQAWPVTKPAAPCLLTDLDEIGKSLVQDEWIGGLDEPDLGDDDPLAYLPPDIDAHQPRGNG